MCDGQLTAPDWYLDFEIVDFCNSIAIVEQSAISIAIA
jgi:hypothetical protein